MCLSIRFIFKQQLRHDDAVIGGVGFTTVQVVVQAINFAYLGDLVA